MGDRQNGPPMMPSGRWGKPRQARGLVDRSCTRGVDLRAGSVCALADSSQQAFDPDTAAVRRIVAEGDGDAVGQLGGVAGRKVGAGDGASGAEDEGVAVGVIIREGQGVGGNVALAQGFPCHYLGIGQGGQSEVGVEGGGHGGDRKPGWVGREIKPEFSIGASAFRFGLGLAKGLNHLFVGPSQPLSGDKTEPTGGSDRGHDANDDDDH